MLGRFRKLAIIAAIAAPLVALGASASAAGAASGGAVRTTAGQAVTSRAASANAQTANATINCNNNISATYTSPNPRLVNWTATESCNTVIGAIAILSSTLYYDGPNGSYAIAEGTHPSQSPSYSVYSTGTASPGFGGNFHVQDTYDILLAPGQGNWNLAPGCFYYLYGSYQGLQCTVKGAEFTLAGNPTISAGGVVNGTDYSANDIHPGTTVAIFGQWFAPADTVTVTDAGQQYTIRSGSPWWYDSAQQINATLPASIPPGPATVTVIAGNGLQSNAAPITIQP
jgi:hypothetical protein